ncbi:MAG: DUF350 domain-containing protein [Anaerolineae bacterium]
MGSLLLSVAQLTIAIILSAVVAFLSFYLFQWFTRDLDEWEELRQRNPAVGVVLGAILVATALMLRPALAVDTTMWDAGYEIYGRVLLAEALQLAVGLVLAVLALGLAVLIFAALTRGIDEIEELKRGNLAVGGLLGGVILGVGLMISQAVEQVMTAISSFLF